MKINGVCNNYRKASSCLNCTKARLVNRQVDEYGSVYDLTCTLCNTVVGDNKICDVCEEEKDSVTWQEGKVKVCHECWKEIKKARRRKYKHS